MFLASAFLASAQAQLTINYDFTPGITVTDNGQISIAPTLGGLGGLSSFDNVVTRLNLTSNTTGDPMYLGDLYSSLTFGNSSETQRTAVLLNRPGRDNTSLFGSSLTSLNVTLDHSASTNVFAATASTGTYAADGRLSVDPNAAGVAFVSGSNGLAALNGTPFSSNRVSLLVADYSAGGTAKLSGWGVSVTGAAAGSGSFTPGSGASISDTGISALNTLGASLDTTGSTAGGLVVNLAGTSTFAAAVTGTGGINKTGTGTLVLSASNNYSGPTKVGNGTLEAAGAGALGGAIINGGTSGITVNTGGTLLLSGTGNRIKDSATLDLAGGTFNTGGTSETLGALTLSVSSIIDFGTVGNTLRFADSSALTWAGASLSIYNWTSGNDHLFFGDGQTTGLLQGQLDKIKFYSDAGSTLLPYAPGFSGFTGGLGEVTPVPEPTAIAVAMSLLGLIGYRERRKVAMDRALSRRVVA